MVNFLTYVFVTEIKVFWELGSDKFQVERMIKYNFFPFDKKIVSFEPLFQESWKADNILVVAGRLVW